MAYPMPDWVFRDTLTVLASSNKRDRSGGVSPVFIALDQGINIKANVAKPQVVDGTIGGAVRNILRAVFTTPANPILTDPSGKFRMIGKGDGLVWSGDGQQWESAGPLTPRVDDGGNPVHYWGTMERVT